jgi:hypothetical protein
MIELERVETCIQRMNVNNLLYGGEEHSIGNNVKWRKKHANGGKE